MMLSGGEVAVKLAGSAAKNAAAMLLALARNHKKVYGKTSLKKILQQTRDIRTFSLTPGQYREFSRQAKDKVLFAGIQDKEQPDAPIDLVIPTTDLELANVIFERLFGSLEKPQEERSSKKESRSERSSDDTGSSLPTSRKSSKNDRPSIGEQLQSFREKLSGVEPHVPAREKRTVRSQNKHSLDGFTRQTVIYSEQQKLGGGVHGRAGIYGFTDQQREMLEELLKPDYDDIFLSLIGNYQPDGTPIGPVDISDIQGTLPDDLDPLRESIVLTAYQLLGKVTYFWGGKSLVLGWDSRWGTPTTVTAPGSGSTGKVLPFGLDCSGFVDWTFYNATNGAYLPGRGGGAASQHGYCTNILWSDALPGDLVFYADDSHVGIVCGYDSVGNILVIHCSGGQNGVVVTGREGFAVAARPDLFTD